MNKTKVAFLFAVGLSMGSAMVTASAADTARMVPGKPAASGKMGQPYVHKGCDAESGMMGSHGHGMMGGYGAGMMGGGMMMQSPRMNMVNALSLSDEQRAKINKLNDQLHHDNWATMGAMMDETAKLRDLYEADRRDPSAIGSEYQKIFDLKRKMIEAMLTTQNKVEDVLTSDQRAQLKEMHKKMGGMYGHYPMH